VRRSADISVNGPNRSNLSSNFIIVTRSDIQVVLIAGNCKEGVQFAVTSQSRTYNLPAVVDRDGVEQIQRGEGRARY
jgi:hypothetical protein